jgi:hypothetical protein
MRTAEALPRTVRFAGVAALCWSGAAGCASNTAPPGWLRPAEDVQLEARGAWIEVTVADAVGSEGVGRVEGELIAAEADTVFVLTPEALEAVPFERIRHVRLTPWRIDQSGLGAWMVLGALSTLSHGALLAFSAPVWFLGGGAAVAHGSGAGQIRTDDPSPLVLRRFARFPQGLLPGIDRAAVESGGLRRPVGGGSGQRRR